MLKKIISNGQSGVAQAALDVSIDLKITHDGWIPKGQITDKDPLPENYNLKEMSTSSYPKCAEKNVIDSDGTLIIYRGKFSKESELSLKYAGKHQKECLCIDLNVNRGFVAAQLIHSWIEGNNIQVLNVSGNRASEDFEIYADSSRLLRAVYQLFFIESKKANPDKLISLSPRTVEEAVDRIFYELPFKEKANLAKLEEHELELLSSDLSEYIIENYGLKFKKGMLMKNCSFMAKGIELNEYEAAELIIKELWMKLRKTHALRVVR
jgi:hypothetical protein